MLVARPSVEVHRTADGTLRFSVRIGYADGVEHNGPWRTHVAAMNAARAVARTSARDAGRCAA